jgi:tryptophanyl-tRNA synthetase
VTSPKRFLSGIKPTGDLHLGNYFGAIREHVRLQDDGESYYFIANYHALTGLRDAARFREYTTLTAVTYLACGLDPARAVLFRQSDVPEVTELTWLLLTVTPVPMLENAVSYKDHKDKGKVTEMGLMTYPVLMAADILAQDSHVVPVGRDQVQHVEMTRDIAQKYNRAFQADVFRIPDYRLGEAPYVVGTDGQKMSKSYGNTIPIAAEGKALEKIVMSIKTDAKGVADPKDPDTCNVFKLYALMANAAEKQALADRYRAGGMGYGDAKKTLLAKIDEVFAPIRARYKALLARPDDVERILVAGAVKARANARAVLARARKACGID